ncbi:MAG: zinc dependent phospholipase C family protein, partial [Acidobacteria bacterium]|nr:zinc dependent phospholipase C family protein [Acidobacteriota bacterium]MCA1652460.1 zinc dependent phospholipase C family protein [Acidobacteriota bacterium]
MNSNRVSPAWSISRRASWCAIGVLTLAGVLFNQRYVAAYSVLAHQNAVDAVWHTDIVPLLRQRFEGLTAPQLAESRAYAYGGSLIQDLGYYPFGSHLFTNLTHYVRSGDFVESLIRGAADANEYAFALGALAHYNSDNAGHPIAVNRAVPLMYPKVRTKVGDRALYADSPARHVMVELAFDVLQVARGAYVTQAYRDRIGFEVSRPSLERAVRETYAMDLDDLLLNVDLAIGTYRRAVGTTIPELTRIAWREKRDEIEKRTPG